MTKYDGSSEFFSPPENTLCSLHLSFTYLDIYCTVFLHELIHDTVRIIRDKVQVVPGVIGTLNSKKSSYWIDPIRENHSTQRKKEIVSSLILILDKESIRQAIKGGNAPTYSFKPVVK